MIDFSSTLPLQVFIDDREPETLFLEFEKRANLFVTKKRLFVGDILFDDEMLVERKTVHDFSQSLKDGRLFDQLRKMSKTKISTILIIEGNEEQLEKSKVRSEAIQAAIAAVSFSFKIPVLRSENIAQTVDMMFHCYRQLEKINALRFPPIWNNIKKKSHHSYDPTLLKKLRVLSAFPGLGPHRSLKLIQKFSTLEKLFSSSKEDFLSVEGIGKKSWNGFDEILRS